MTMGFLIVLSLFTFFCLAAGFTQVYVGHGKLKKYISVGMLHTNTRYQQALIFSRLGYILVVFGVGFLITFIDEFTKITG